jgi:uncharacterized protein YhfF
MKALNALVLSGVKRATASLAWRYEHDPVPQSKAGDLSIVTSWSKQPLCIIETTAVEVVPFNEVTEDFARTEGEDDGTLESWRRSHTKFFAGECARIGRTPSESMLVVCERFRVVFQPPGTPAARPDPTIDAIYAATALLTKTLGDRGGRLEVLPSDKFRHGRAPNQGDDR